MKKTPQLDLPPDVVEADLKELSWKSKSNFTYQEIRAMGLETNSLEFYKTTGFGWVITTLHIRGKGRAATDRSYGITVGGTCCRVGRGPHVTKVVRVYLNKKNIKRLQKYVDLYNKGLTQAGVVRDRISSRRAQGQINRQAGLTSWFWK